MREEKNPSLKHYCYCTVIIIIACDLILLGSIDVPNATGEGVIAEAVQQLDALDLPIMTVVNFKASNNGVTVTDTTNGYCM